MSSVQKFLMFVAGLILTVFFIMAAYNVYHKSNDTYKEGTKQLTRTEKEFTDADKSIYNDITESGSGVIRTIDKYWEDDTTEVVVCTLDGKNLIYSKRAYDMAVGNTASGTYQVPNIVSGLPSADCTGVPFASEDGSATAELKIAVSTAYSGGYDKALSAASAGYIAEQGTFKGSVQRDQNGLVRRITFIQQ